MALNLQIALPMAVVAGLAAGATLRATYASDRPDAEAAWSTKRVMDKCFVGKQSLVSVVNKDLRKAEPDWKSDEENLTEIIRLMSTLTRQQPPRGTQENWDRLAQDYVDGAKAARQNIKQHRLQPARAALEKARATCEECHDSHGLK